MCDKATRLGRLAIKAGPGEVKIPDAELLAALQEVRGDLVRGKSRLRQRRLRLLNRAVSDTRKQDTRRKIMLGGLVIKAGLAMESEAVLLGLLSLAAKALHGPDADRHRTRFREAGDLAFQEDAKNKQTAGS